MTLAIADLIKHQSQLKLILDKINKLHQLNLCVRQYLPDHIRPYCEVANYTQHRLVCLVENGAIATAFHFLVPELLKCFQQDPHLSPIKEIICKVRHQSR